jgi:tetratricopeptide (TPR) repeat protein
MYIPLFLWLISMVSAFFMSVDRNLAFYGMNYTLENSFVEALMIFVFLIILINNIRTTEDLESIIRSILIGISVSFVYTIMRYSAKWTINDELLRYYVNSNTFSPTGEYTALPTLALLGIILGLGLVITDVVYQRKLTSIVVDTITTVIHVTTFVISINLGGQRPEYLHLISAIIALVLVVYIVLSYSRIQKALVPLISIIIFGIILGTALYYGITKNAAQPIAYPSVSLDAAWNITLDSIKGSIQSGLFGIGYGSFGYAFDQFKNESVALPINNRDGQPILTNFTINAQSPSTEEIRVYQPSSIMLGILMSQGIFGIVAIILIAIFSVYVCINKKIENLGVIGTHSFIAFITGILLLIITKQDFTTLFLVWISLGIFIISASVDEPSRNLIIALAGRHINFNTNFTYILPILALCGLVYTLVKISPILLANYYAYQAKVAQKTDNLEAYIQNSNLAFNTFPLSDVFIRESVFSRAVKLSNDIDNLLAKIKETDGSNNNDLDQQINKILYGQNILSRDLQIARVQNPKEYKNYYLEGLMISRVSELVELQLDANAIQYFQSAVQRNPHHPESYYQIARILNRSAKDDSDRIVARNAITLALRYRPVNLSYQALYADILKNLGSYDKALEIYQFIKQLRDANPDNQLLTGLYESQQIENKIKEIQKINSGSTEKSQLTISPQPSSVPTISVTPTPTRRNW